MPVHGRVEIREFAPKAWARSANCWAARRAGSPRRGATASSSTWAEARTPAPWQPPSAQVKGWYKDGDWFVHFLDSPEQGLLTIVVWSDIRPTGAGRSSPATSVPVVARFLAEHPEGVRPGGSTSVARGPVPRLHRGHRRGRRRVPDTPLRAPRLVAERAPGPAPDHQPGRQPERADELPPAGPADYSPSSGPSCGVWVSSGSISSRRRRARASRPSACSVRKRCSKRRRRAWRRSRASSRARTRSPFAAQQGDPALVDPMPASSTKAPAESSRV